MSQTHKAELEINMDQASLADAGSAADFISLMKPRVMSLVVFTALVGLIMAPVSLNPVLAVSAVILIALGAGASAALNMWYDADIDAVMARTKDTARAGRAHWPGRCADVRPVDVGPVGAEHGGADKLCECGIAGIYNFLLCGDLHHDVEAAHGTEYRHWRRCRCVSSGHWLGGGDRFHFS
ncbi:MAG: hypothetical protein CM15mP55_0590 [Hyphomicrobiales bacterium]|nr:MAG: hypothetical protein CM15mP55_0590 [Hyphomicrobiales bacterium]